MSDHAGGRPVLRVVSGDATAEEIAAVLAVVAARAGGGGDAGPAEPGTAEPGTADAWAARGHAHRTVRASFTPSRHGWKTSFWPR